MKYEVILLIKPSLTEDAAKKALESVKSLVAENQGSVEKEDLWGKKRLAYQLGKFQDAYYGELYFDLPPANIKKVSDKLNRNENLMRSLVSSKGKKG